jgi:hypothetical protein
MSVSGFFWYLNEGNFMRAKGDTPNPLSFMRALTGPYWFFRSKLKQSYSILLSKYVIYSKRQSLQPIF